jgi:20S proteasome alpha/beta subunit
MTIGIAATCDFGTDSRKLILCSDWQVTSELGAAQTHFKEYNLGNGWHCLYAGNPSSARILVSGLRNKLVEHKRPIDETNVLPIIQSALNERKFNLCNEFVQGRFAMSYDAFLQTGKSNLPADRFLSSIHAIENILLGAEFLIVGFLSGFPIIIQTDQRCGASIKESFACIGEGSYLAHASLMHREHDEMAALGTTLYSVYEAKKWAERNRTVGDQTAIDIIHGDGTTQLVTRNGKDLLDKKFAEYGPKAVPGNLSLPNEVFQDSSAMVTS